MAGGRWGGVTWLTRLTGLAGLAGACGSLLLCLRRAGLRGERAWSGSVRTSWVGIRGRVGFDLRREVCLQRRSTRPNLALPGRWSAQPTSMAANFCGNGIRVGRRSRLIGTTRQFGRPSFCTPRFFQALVGDSGCRPPGSPQSPAPPGPDPPKAGGRYVSLLLRAGPINLRQPGRCRKRPCGHGLASRTSRSDYNHGVCRFRPSPGSSVRAVAQYRRPYTGH